MRKIPSLFKRDWQADAQGSRKVVDEIQEGSEWVVRGEGVPTRKWDGLAVRVLDGRPWRRYDAKSGKTPPDGFDPAQESPDPKSGHWPGWLPAKAPDDRWLLEGLAWGSANLYGGAPVPDGTYEVCGPRIGTRHGPNPEGLDEHILVPHGRDILAGCPREFNALRSWLAERPIEGVVWHHPDGRMVKIKKNDFATAPAPVFKPKP